MDMKQIIKDVLEDMANGQINLGSLAARENIASLISAALKTKGCYTEYGDDDTCKHGNSLNSTCLECDEQQARDSWVCGICGESTYDVDYDHVGSGTNHLGCELEIEMKNEK